MELDCVIPVAAKDLDICRICIRSLRQLSFTPPIGRIFVVVKNPDVDAQAFGFGQEDRVFYRAEADFSPPANISGWLKQQLIKLYAPIVLDLPAVLVVDADVTWLRSCQFMDGNGCALWNFFDAGSVPFICSHVDLHRFFPFLQMWNLDVRKPLMMNGNNCCSSGNPMGASHYSKGTPMMSANTNGRNGASGSSAEARITAVTHHGVFLRPVIEALMMRAEELFGKPLWQVFVDSTVPCSEYDLYFAFAHEYFPSTIRPRRLAFRVAADPTLYDDVTYVVSHSHLRHQTESQLSKREGAINGICAQNGNSISKISAGIKNLPPKMENPLRLLNEVYSAYLSPNV